MQSSLRIASCARTLIRNAPKQQYASTAGQKLPPPSEHLRRLQEHFQKNDGLPIHLKGGPMDKFLYVAIMSGLAMTTSYSLYLFYTLAVPKK